MEPSKIRFVIVRFCRRNAITESLYIERVSYSSLLDKITNFYLSSPGFNGLPVYSLLRSRNSAKIKNALSDLLLKELISIVFGDYHPNPHIKALPPEPIEEQLEKLQSHHLAGSCVYPTPLHLKTMVDVNSFRGRPFTLYLAHGEPQLTYRSFDLAILEAYRNDPRYYYRFDDINGQISMHDDFCGGGDVPEGDQVLLESFGVSLDLERKMYVAAFLRYLAALSPEHQQVWSTKLVVKETILHPDYYRTAILGAFPERLSVYQAVLLEIQASNDMSAAIGRPPIFLEDFRTRQRPRNFGYLLRPTLQEFNEFVLLLDKMLSDNINRSFFSTDVAFETEEERNDGRILVRPKGTIKLLEDWLNLKFETEDPSGFRELIEIFRRVRQLRQKPAHAINPNIFDHKYINDQRELMHAAYKAVSTLRRVLQSHPAARGTRVH